jgi:hypothetical protein
VAVVMAAAAVAAAAEAAEIAGSRKNEYY